MRAQVIAAAREMLRLDLVSGTAGNVSARLDDARIVVTPTGLRYDDMMADDLVVVHVDGRVLGGRHPPSGELALHLACYRRYPEVGAVLHTHPVHATMFACAREPIPAAIDEFAIYVGGDVRCADYAPSGTPALGANAVAYLADVGTALLASHGMVTVATSPAEAVHQAAVVERAARILWGARHLGGWMGLPPGAVSELAAAYRRIRFAV